MPRSRQTEENMAIYISFSSPITQVTTENLLGLLGQQACAGVDEVHLALSTPGGSVMLGINAYNVMRAMPFKLITYNVGNVNSIGNVVFLAGTERYACETSSFMFHGVGFDSNGTQRFEEKHLRERLDGILNDQKLIGDIIRDRTNINAKEVRALFRAAATKGTAYAIHKGIISSVRPFIVPQGSQFLQLVFKG
jgi:ATP-dependent Clp protease, protease subunit